MSKNFCVCEILFEHGVRHRILGASMFANISQLLFPPVYYHSYSGLNLDFQNGKKIRKQ